MSDDLVTLLERLALTAETANHWTDEHRLMPAAGVADIVYEAKDRIEELEATGLANRVAIMRLEAYLAKIICIAGDMAEAIEDQIDTCDASMDEQVAVKNYRTTLAELTGGPDA